MPWMQDNSLGTLQVQAPLALKLSSQIQQAQEPIVQEPAPTAAPSPTPQVAVAAGGGAIPIPIPTYGFEPWLTRGGKPAPTPVTQPSPAMVSTTVRPPAPAEAPAPIIIQAPPRERPSGPSGWVIFALSVAGFLLAAGRRGK